MYRFEHYTTVEPNDVSAIQGSWEEIVRAYPWLAAISWGTALGKPFQVTFRFGIHIATLEYLPEEIAHA